MLLLKLLTLCAVFAVEYSSDSDENQNTFQGALHLWKSGQYLKFAPLLFGWKFVEGEVGLDPVAHVESFNYPVEKHEVETEDGYILTLHRIPYGLKHNGSDRPPILLNPGLFCSSNCFIDVGPERALAFFLVDHGYDVWIANWRGTTFSRKHSSLEPSQKEFWNFSWHEIGTIDLPNTIDYVLSATDRPKVSVIGHSQGTTISFVMAAEKPAYNKKVKVFIGLAPVAYMENVPSFLKILCNQRDIVMSTLHLVGIYEMFPHNDKKTEYVKKVCNPESIQPECMDLINLFTEYNPEMFDVNDVHIIAEHLPGGASTRQLTHFGQSIDNGGFRQYDFGHTENNAKYGSAKPPRYKLNNIKMPVYLIYGEKDILATPMDSFNLYKSLRNSKLYRVNYKKFNHGDFLWGKHVIRLVYNFVLKILSQHNR